MWNCCALDLVAAGSTVSTVAEAVANGHKDPDLECKLNAITEATTPEPKADP
jgi:hypothetical protein